LSDVDAGGVTVFLDIEEVVYPRKVCGIQGFKVTNAALGLT